MKMKNILNDRHSHIEQVELTEEERLFRAYAAGYLDGLEIFLQPISDAIPSKEELKSHFEACRLRLKLICEDGDCAVGDHIHTS